MDVLEAQRVWQANHIHMQAGQTTSQHEATRKKPKQTNLQVLKKWPKTNKRGNNVKRKGKENKKTEEATQHAAGRSSHVSKPECMKKADGNIKKLCGTGNFRCENYATRKL